MAQRVSNPYPVFLDTRGRPLTGGRVYIGVAGQDPEVKPLPVYAKQTLEVQLPQPVRTIGGLLVNSGNPTLLFVDAAQYSMRVRDADGKEVFYTASTSIASDDYQPADSDLTAIAALSTTSYGRNLLVQANQEAARNYLGITPALPLAGGVMTGNIQRQGAGGHAYAANGAYGSLRLFFTDNGAADPRERVGDIWFEAVP